MTPERIAYLLKARIKESFGITCSIGIAPNKLLAKLASDMQKPDGLTIIKLEDVSRILERMPIDELCGILPAQAMVALSVDAQEYQVPVPPVHG